MAASALLACRVAERPPDSELYVLLLEHVTSELRLPSPIALHPFLALWNPANDDVITQLSSFNAFDSASVPAVVEARPAHYRLCRPTLSGACAVAAGDAAIVLSELRDIADNEVALRFLVTDGRQGRDYQQHYVARLKAGLTGWSVVELRRMPD